MDSPRRYSITFLDIPAVSRNACALKGPRPFTDLLLILGFTFSFIPYAFGRSGTVFSLTRGFLRNCAKQNSAARGISHHPETYGLPASRFLRRAKDSFA